ncbi:hypothetical protein ACWC09_26750 [Streptomyces sp. NPDC001617]
MSHDDDHVQETWNLIRDADGDEVTIDLWTDGENVRVEGGDFEACDIGRGYITGTLLPKYEAAGYRVDTTYEVNDPAPHDEPVEDDDPEPHGRPEKCPDCGGSIVYDPRYGDDYREGAAWLCTACKWGQWLTA